MTPDYKALREAAEKIMHLRTKMHLPPDQRGGCVWTELDNFGELCSVETIISLLDALAASEARVEKAREALTMMVEMSGYWINLGKPDGSSQERYEIWLALGHRSKAMQCSATTLKEII